jgi:hypothetical protein
MLVIAITIVAIEIAGHWIGNNAYFWEARQLFLSKGALRPLGNDGLWTYAPDSTILSAATYRLAQWDGWVEYRCHLKTNRFGLVDTNVAPSAADVDVLVLGDSFLEGQGGCPWLTSAVLEPGYPAILNGGLQGASLQSMELLEQWLSRQIRIRNVVLVLISNDFSRRLIPHIWQSREGCLLGGDCQPGLDYVWGVDPSVSESELLGISSRVLQAGGTDLWSQLHMMLRFHSLSYSLVLRYLDLLDKPNTSPTKDEFDSNVQALERLHKKYPSMRIVQAPQRDEVGLLGRDNLDTTRMRQALAERNIEHTTCPLDTLDYMPIDGHPNVQGYGKIRACLFAGLGVDKFRATPEQHAQSSTPRSD